MLPLFGEQERKTKDMKESASIYILLDLSQSSILIIGPLDMVHLSQAVFPNVFTQHLEEKIS